MGDDAARTGGFVSSANLLEHVQVVLDVFDRGVVGQCPEKSQHRVFGVHVLLLHADYRRTSPCWDAGVTVLPGDDEKNERKDDEEGITSWGSRPQGDMRREHRFDYRQARPNRVAAIVKGRMTAVVLRGRALLESVAGEAVQFRLVEYEDPEREFYEQRYRDWPDRSIPALGHRTPRQAAALERRRFRVVELLQAFENASDRRRLAGCPAYDIEPTTRPSHEFPASDGKWCGSESGTIG